ncbi:MAG: TonB-dependent receptor [Rikenellaceae bacterium]
MRKIFTLLVVSTLITMSTNSVAHSRSSYDGPSGSEFVEGGKLSKNSHESGTSSSTANRSLEQQRIDLKGVVKDTSGIPIAGATVLVKGTTIGAVTGGDGSYSMKVPAGSTVEVTFFGYKTQEFEVGSRTTLDVILEEDALSVDEVVVVGYGQQKKVSVTGAVAAIDNAAIKQSPTSNLEGALAGKLPGLSVMQGSSQPGAEDFQIRLRGASTSNGQDPLILVDGVPRDNLNMLDANEVASISILKDASATAVFGVRGANGVILVTTRTGDSEKPTLSATAEFSVQEFTSDYDMMDSWQYATLYNQARVNDGFNSYYSDRQIQLYKDGTSPYYPNTDWFDLLYKDLSTMQRYNVNLSGKTNKVNYFVNVGMINQNGMVQTADPDELGYDPSYKLNRVNFRTNLDVKVNSWITAGVKLAGYIDNIGSPYKSQDNQYNLIKSIYSTSPTSPLFADESFGIPMDALVSNGTSSPYGDLNLLGYAQEDKSVLNSTVSMDFDLGKVVTKGLSAKLMVSYDTTASSTVEGSKSNYNVYKMTVTELDGQDTYAFTTANDYQLYRISLSKEYLYQYAMNMQGMINYNREFGESGEHAVGGMFVYQRDNSEASSGDNIDLLPYNYIGYAGRATYAYDERYLAEFNVGYNGSEQFAEGKRFDWFPAASLGWVISNEAFMQDVNWISNFKVRGSYGKVGNDTIGDTRFLYMDNNTVTTGGYTTAGNEYRVSETLIGNPDVTWEIAYKQNYGIDMTFLNNSLTLTADYFRERRENILITRNSVPTTLGNSLSVLPKGNIGIVENHGYEIEVGYKKQIGRDFNMNIRGSASYAENTVIESDEMYLGDEYVYPIRSEGFSMGTIWGYEIDWDSPGNGYFTSQEEIDNHATYSGTAPRVGDFVYKDANGDGTISAADQVPIGEPTLPKFNYSLNMYFGYKNFDFSALFSGIGNSHFNYNNSSHGITETDSVYQEHHLASWTMERYLNGEEITYPALTSTSSSSLATNDFFVCNRKYLRLKNVEIGYTLPSSISKKMGMSKLRVYTNGTNLLTWDSIPFEMVDPEQRGSTSVLPIMRVFNFGANITF